MDIASLVENKRNPKIPDIAPGDTVKVSAKIVEGGKERIQVFQGVVIQVKKGGAGASFTVRHVAFGIGVERTFPFYSPLVEKVEIVRHGKVRRAKLYYLRGLSGRQARRKIKRVEKKVEAIGAELLEPEPEEVLEPQEVLGEAGELVAVEAEPEESAESVTKEAIEEPEATAKPAAEVAEAAEPVTEEALEEPKIVEEPVAEEPKSEEAVEEPAVTEEPKPVEEPAAEFEEAEEPKAEEVAEEPVVEAVEKPVAEEEIKEPTTEEIVEEPESEEEKS